MRVPALSLFMPARTLSKPSTMGVHQDDPADKPKRDGVDGGCIPDPKPKPERPDWLRTIV